MTITAAFVLYAVLWFMAFLIILPLKLETQGDRGEIVPGTHAGAPVDPQIRRRARLATIWAAGLWLVCAGIIYSGWISIADLDVFGRPGPLTP